MLSRKQFSSVQIARGMTTEEIIAKSGIPPQSFMVLMDSDGKDGRDPAKLISESTFRRLALVLGLEPGMSGLRTSGVIEWRVNQKQRSTWQAAVTQLRNELFGDRVEMTVINNAHKWYSPRRDSMVFIHSLGDDQENDIKLAVTGADAKIVRFLTGLFGVEAPRKVEMDTKEFLFTAKLIENGVYRANQFFIVLGGRAVRYTWADVQAAAKEFNFTTDALIELMVATLKVRAEPSAETPPEASVEERPTLRVANG